MVYPYNIELTWRDNMKRCVSLHPFRLDSIEIDGTRSAFRAMQQRQCTTQYREGTANPKGPKSAIVFPEASTLSSGDNLAMNLWYLA